MIFTLHQSTIDNSVMLEFVANPYTKQDEQDQAWEVYDMLQNAGFHCYLACYGKYDNAVEMFPTPERIVQTPVIKSSTLIKKVKL